jgi:hypothetical protein
LTLSRILLIRTLVDFIFTGCRLFSSLSSKKIT